MKTLFSILLLLPFSLFAQETKVEDNTLDQIKIINMIKEMNPNLRESLELNKEADEFLVMWIDALEEGDPSKFNPPKGFMTVCNIWRLRDRKKYDLSELLSRDEPKTLKVRNNISNSLYEEIMTSSEIGVSMYTLKDEYGYGIEVYVAMFR